MDSFSSYFCTVFLVVMCFCTFLRYFRLRGHVTCSFQTFQKIIMVSLGFCVRKQYWKPTKILEKCVSNFATQSPLNTPTRQEP